MAFLTFCAAPSLYGQDSIIARGANAPPAPLPQPPETVPSPSSTAPAPPPQASPPPLPGSPESPTAQGSPASPVAPAAPTARAPATRPAQRDSGRAATPASPPHPEAPGPYSISGSEPTTTSSSASCTSAAETWKSSIRRASARTDCMAHRLPHSRRHLFLSRERCARELVYDSVARSRCALCSTWTKAAANATERTRSIQTGRFTCRTESPSSLRFPAPLDDGSFLYFVRTIPLEVGQTYNFDRYFNPKANPVTIRCAPQGEGERASRDFRCDRRPADHQDRRNLLAEGRSADLDRRRLYTRDAADEIETELRLDRPLSTLVPPRGSIRPLTNILRLPRPVPLRSANAGGALYTGSRCTGYRTQSRR